MGLAFLRLWSVAWRCILLRLLFLQETLAVAVTEVRLLSDSNRSQYVLHGEGATLTCHYVLDANERVRSVMWDKDGTEVYVWSATQHPVAKDVFTGRVNLDNKSPSTIIITKAHMGMQGTYTCRVDTNEKTAQNEVYVTVIVDSCEESAWKTYTDMITCTETISMRCTGMFPKPSPACGIYSEQMGRFLTSVPFDRVTPLENGTFEITLNRWYNVKDWLNHTDITFRCHVLVLGTTWRSGISHRLFGDPGCSIAPPEIDNGYYNITDELSCWGMPREGATVMYHCEPGFEMRGAKTLMCRNGLWVPHLTSSRKFPTCSNDASTRMAVVSLQVSIITSFYLLLT